VKLVLDEISLSLTSVIRSLINTLTVRCSNTQYTLWAYWLENRQNILLRWLRYTWAECATGCTFIDWLLHLNLENLSTNLNKSRIHLHHPFNFENAFFQDPYRLCLYSMWPFSRHFDLLWPWLHRRGTGIRPFVWLLGRGALIPVLQGKWMGFSWRANRVLWRDRLRWSGILIWCMGLWWRLFPFAPMLQSRRSSAKWGAVRCQYLTWVWDCDLMVCRSCFSTTIKGTNNWHGRWRI
jgi:hypothetical protein